MLWWTFRIIISRCADLEEAIQYLLIPFAVRLLVADSTREFTGRSDTVSTSTRGLPRQQSLPLQASRSTSFIDGSGYRVVAVPRSYQYAPRRAARDAESYATDVRQSTAESNYRNYSTRRKSFPQPPHSESIHPLHVQYSTRRCLVDTEYSNHH